ncbi:MAG: ribosome maturation factor RimM [Bacteroidia bacterium]|nr:ribosome maturation factor RimM [Bacteroidia bacterium]
MNKNECFNLGYISKSVGIKGEVLFQLDVDNAKRYQKLESVFMELNGGLVPFFITNIQLRGNSALVQLDGIDSTQKAQELVGTSLYLPLSLLPELKGNKFYYHEVPGFAVIDAHHGNIGEVETVLDFPQQAILQIKKGTKEILLPIKDEFVKKIDRAKKEIQVVAPEGLIELYLEDEISDEEE